MPEFSTNRWSKTGKSCVLIERLFRVYPKEITSTDVTQQEQVQNGLQESCEVWCWVSSEFAI